MNGSRGERGIAERGAIGGAPCAKAEEGLPFGLHDLLEALFQAAPLHPGCAA